MPRLRSPRRSLMLAGLLTCTTQGRENVSLYICEERHELRRTTLRACMLQKNSSVDPIVLNEHSADAIMLLRANGHEWMLYNGGSRFRIGFYLAMASHTYGCRGLYDFAFSSVRADPYYALDSREDDLCVAFTTPPLATSATSPATLLLNTVQTMREGLSDLHYTKLRSLVDEHRQAVCEPCTHVV